MDMRVWGILCFLIVIRHVLAKPIATPSRQLKLSKIQDLEGEIEKAVASGRLRDAVRLEQSMENEILLSALEELVLEKQDKAIIEDMMQRDTKIVEKIAKKLEGSEGSESELRAVGEELKRNKRAVELLSGLLGSSSGGTTSTGSSSTSSANDGDNVGTGSILTSILGASSGNANKRLTRDTDQINEINSILTDMVTEVTLTNNKIRKVVPGSQLIAPMRPLSVSLAIKKEEQMCGSSNCQPEVLAGGVHIVKESNKTAQKKDVRESLTAGTGLIGGVEILNKPTQGNEEEAPDDQEPFPTEPTIGSQAPPPPPPPSPSPPPSQESDLIGSLFGLVGPLSSASSSHEGDSHDGEGGSDILGLIGPLISQKIEKIGNLAGAAVGIIGPLSSKVIEVKHEGSDVASALLGLVGQLSASSSSVKHEGSDFAAALLGLVGQLSTSSAAIKGSSHGGCTSDCAGGSHSDGGGASSPDGVGGGSGLLTGLLGSSSGGGGGDGDGGGSNVLGLISGLSGSSSAGGGDGTIDLTNGEFDDKNQTDNDGAGGGGSNILGLISGLSGSSSAGGQGGNPEDGGAGSNPLSLVTSLLGSSSAGGTGDGSDGGAGSGGLITSLLGSSSAGGGGGAAGGEGGDSSGGSGGLLSGLLGSSSGGADGGGAGATDVKGQLLSTLFRIKFAIFRSLLSLVTGFLSSSSAGKG